MTNLFNNSETFFLKFVNKYDIILDENYNNIKDIYYLNNENNHIYDDDFKLHTQDDSFMFSELIREKIIRKLGDELPHDTFVEIDLIKEKENITEVHAIIYVSRQSQKQIVIGSKGDVLKKIGKQARLEIEKYLNKKVFLKTWVKVKKNWNTDSGFIQSLGVGGNYESE